MKRILYLLGIISAVTFSACSKDPVPAPEPDPVVDNYDATISLTTKSVSLAADDGATGNLMFACDHEWTLEMPEDASGWLSASKTSGGSTKNTMIKFTATANPLGEERTATCRILSGASKKKFTVTQARSVLILSAGDVPDIDKYYKPGEFDFDMLRSDSKWSWCRSKQSEHFVVFWDKKYGEYGLYGSKKGVADSSPTTCSTTSMRVDIDDLLKKAELFYDMNVNKLKFVDVSDGKSCLNHYKMEIYILYQSEWLATGSGYDNEIGALWVNPSTCQPVGSTIAHEIGHCFQYMVYVDYLRRTGKPDNSRGPGWRYGYGANGSGGNAFWEQCAQWQSLQKFDASNDYHPQAFTSYDASNYYASTYMHVLHEYPRYANYFIHWYWVEKNGGDLSFIGKLWREAEYPEDPCETYMRIMGMDNAAFNDDIWQYGAHMTTFDTDEIRTYGKSYVGKQAIKDFTTVDGKYRVSKAHAPESTGYNSIRLSLPAAGTTVSVDFKGLPGLEGYHSGPVTNAGWRYGFVALLNDGTSDYSEVFRESEGTGSYTVPAGAKQLYLVVTGAPVNYERHPWGDETVTNDNRWPYEFSLTGAKLY